MMRGTIFALALAAAGCLGRYTPGPDPQPPPPAQQQPAPSQPSSPTPSPTPAPPETPPAPTPPPASDGGTTTTPPPTDGGTTSACAQLDACCQELPSDQVQGCLDQVANLDENVCQGILDQLEQAGYCP